jgi:hypothetical protein
VLTVFGDDRMLGRRVAAILPRIDVQAIPKTDPLYIQLDGLCVMLAQQRVPCLYGYPLSPPIFTRSPLLSLLFLVILFWMS